MEIVSTCEKLKDDARRLLEEAISKDFESVFVIGMKDGRVFISSSEIRNLTLIIGALEEAKYHVLSGTYIYDGKG